jgi:acetolactate synthase-1/2/3 large subunit
MISGGGAMHLNDAAGRRMRYFCNHHEQASAIAAEGYARASGRPAVVLVTTGPGGLNTLTGSWGSGPTLFPSSICPVRSSLRQRSSHALPSVCDSLATRR